jgi:hypothetical protein
MVSESPWPYAKIPTHSSGSTPVLCAQCSASLPDVALFCPRCGSRVGPNSIFPPQPVVHCRHCHATLPSGSRYCLSCGRPIETNTPRELENPPAAEVFPSPTLVRRAAPLPLRRTSRWLGLSLGAVVLLGGFLWMVSSESPLAQSIQEYVGWKHDEGVLDGSFSIAPGAIQVYTVSLPEGSVGALLFGQFSSQSAVPGTKNGNIVRPADSNVEVFVMTEPAFTNWQSGYNVTSLMKADVHRTGSSAPSCLLRTLLTTSFSAIVRTLRSAGRCRPVCRYAMAVGCHNRCGGSRRASWVGSTSALPPYRNDSSTSLIQSGLLRTSRGLGPSAAPTIPSFSIRSIRCAARP